MRTLRTLILALIVLSAGFHARAWNRANGADSAPFTIRPPRSRPDNRYQRRALDNLLDPARKPVEAITLLVFRVSFTDSDFSASRDSVYYANELRHLNEYFSGASGGRFAIAADLYASVVPLSRPEAYYGEDGVWDERMAEMLMEVVEATDAAIDYSRYDAFAVIHAGAGQETDFNGDSSDQLWSGFIDPEEMTEILADTTGTPGVPTNDTVGGDTVYVDNLMIWPEDASQDGLIFGSLGIYAYQVGLRIGMVPLFDTTPSGFPDSQGIGAFGLMGYGLYNAAGFIPAFPCAFHRYLMGWRDAIDVTADAELRMTDINTGTDDDTTLVRLPISATEYFLVANRVHDTDFDGRFDFTDVGNDDPIPENVDTLLGAEFDFFLTSSTNPDDPFDTGSGLMVWHIDEAIIARQLASGRRPEDDPRRKGVDLEEADAIQDLDRPGGKHAFGSYYDSFREGANDRFGVGTDPSSENNAGVRSGITIENISSPGPIMTASVLFDRPFAEVRAEVTGGIGDLSPIPVDLDGAGGEELVVPLDGGRIVVAAAADEESWDGGVETLVSIPGVTWAGSPVFADVDGDGAPEIFITSEACSLYAFTATGEPFGIDDDESPGVFSLPDTICSAPMAYETDGDPNPEVIVLVQDGDSVWLYLIGSSIDPPGQSWTMISSEMRALEITEGLLISHTARAHEGLITEYDGMYFVTAVNDLLIAHFFHLSEEGGALAYFIENRPLATGTAVPGQGLLPAAGDIDGNGEDEMVLAIPGRGVVYTDPANADHVNSIVALNGDHPSPPILADVDRDGVLETIVRDETALYVYAGFGVPVSGWPVLLPDAVAEADRAIPPPAPVVGDIDGDGRAEIIFFAGGDLYAYDISGRSVSGWPLPGAGDGAGSPALLSGEGNALFVFSASSPLRVEGTDITGPAYGASRTSLLRYDVGVSGMIDQAWPFHRRDAGGSGRQEPSDHQIVASNLVDENSFIVYPNPATSGAVTARVVIRAEATVRVRILTLEGEAVIDRSARHTYSPGSTVPFEEEISTDSMSSGIYICHIEVEGGGRSWSGVRTFAVVR